MTADPDKRGRKVHGEIKQFATISTPMFCGSCHDVTLLNGFRLEEAYSEYRLSPAAKNGVTCQDCHMGKVQGIVSGYDKGPAAIVGGVPTKSRKLTNHFFAGRTTRSSTRGFSHTTPRRKNWPLLNNGSSSTIRLAGEPTILRTMLLRMPCSPSAGLRLMTVMTPGKFLTCNSSG